MKTTTLLALVFGLIVMVVSGRSVLSVASFDHALSEYAALVQRDERMATAISDASAIAIDLETGVRGWLLTGDDHFRDPYERRAAVRVAAFNRLVDATLHEASAHSVAKQLQVNVEQWDTRVASVLLSPASRRLSPAELLGLNMEGKRRMDSMRADFAKLTEMGARHRETHTASRGSLRSEFFMQSWLASGIISMLFIGLALVLARGVARPLAQLAAHAQRTSHGQLEAIEVKGVYEASTLAASLSAVSARLSSERDEKRHLTDLVAGLSAELQAHKEELEAQEEELRMQREKLVAKQVELGRRNEALVEASRLKTEFLSSMSHELRTPLNAVLGFADILLSGTYGELSDEQCSSVADISAAGQQLLALVNDILDLSKIEAGRLDIATESVDIGVVLDEVMPLVLPEAQLKGVQISHAIPTGMFFCAADSTRARQVLLNLLANAIHFTPTGGTVEVCVSPASAGNRVEVADSGIGISKVDQRSLFRPFRQLGDRRAQGTGLGLSICKRLVELMGGTMGVTSVLGKGSTFFFTLPLASARHPSARPLSSRPPPQRSPSSRPPPSCPPLVKPEASGAAVEMLELVPPHHGPTHTILVVEDEPTDAKVTEGLLLREGYRVRVVPTAEAALEELELHRPTVVIIDVGLPGMSGFSLIETIRSSALLRGTQIVVLTDRDLSTTEEENLHSQVQLIATKGMMTRIGFIDAIANLHKNGAIRARVLVIDDSEMNRRVIRAMLDPSHYQVLEAAGAAAGVQMAQDAHPELILMDIRMPDIDGLRAASALRADSRTADIPIIAVSAQAMPGDREKALDAGCMAYLTKPVASHELLQFVSDALHTTNGRGDLTVAMAD